MLLIELYLMASAPAQVRFMKLGKRNANPVLAPALLAVMKLAAPVVIRALSGLF